MHALGRQPLFQFIGAIIVLLVADAEPYLGIAIAVIWIAWIWISHAYNYNFTRTQ
jgi:hypothetical protein